MENNEEHTLDSFFKKSLENQDFIPPANLWENIAAETIQKENKKIKPMIKYLFFTAGFLLISALIFLGINKSTFVEANHIAQKAEIVSSTSISNKPQSILKKENISQQNPLNETQKPISIEVPTFSKAKPTEPKGIKPINDEKLSNEAYSSSAILEQEPKSSNVKLKEIKHKDLILRDLSAIFKEKLTNKVRPIDTLNDEIFEEESEKKGSKFSLKHPIISFDYGLMTNDVTYKSDNYSPKTAIYPDKSSSTGLRASIAWKISEKSRMGISLGYNRYNLGEPYVSLPAWSSALGIQTATYNIKNATPYYSTVMALGTVNIPVEKFEGLPTKKPNQLDSTRQMIALDNHRMTTINLAISTQHDVVSLQSKKSKYLNLKIYSIADFSFQRQITYQYAGTDALSLLSSSSQVALKGRITYESKHLENASDFIFGVRVGVGLRWQFSPTLGFHVEGTTQNSFNSWVKNQEVNTYLRNNGINLGINLSL
ncbi:hypothetical protein [Arcicella rigui]|uniref:Outer membrane protein beta-barrel domain-containing protein n=1 Tax=Arcicella rigui TaxID=797020 RepID=A0ABU5QCP6_9BACT|nr:hypothetical protein [Arcicella rigui]MEA5140625.1 hypothetical protein [Arcicella rigui]